MADLERERKKYISLTQVNYYYSFCICMVVPLSTLHLVRKNYRFITAVAVEMSFFENIVGK